MADMIVINGIHKHFLRPWSGAKIDDHDRPDRLC